MSVAAVMLVKDEADIIAVTVRHLLAQVDFVIVSDNVSTDGTAEIVGEIADETGRVLLTLDEEVGYFQAEKTTKLAQRAYDLGYRWVVPCDADEIWYSPFGRVGDILDGAPVRTMFLDARLKNHVATSSDPPEPDPTARQGWHIRIPERPPAGELTKVACRTSPDLQIGMGNHDAVTSGLIDSRSSALLPGRLYIHHFPWRSVEQFERKIRNGVRAYAAARNIDPQYGEHWRAFGMPEDDGFASRVRGWFFEWAYREAPERDRTLVYEPAPVSR